jgi:MarR family transcriptional regulator, organic hydroperoxide resistance regulator
MPSSSPRAGPARPVRNPPLSDATQQIVTGLRRIVRAIELYSQEVYKRYGLTGPQLWAIKTLSRRGPLATSELAEALAVQPSTLSVLVDRLERRRLVRRLRSRADRRFVEIGLTAKGTELARRAPEPAQGRLLHGLRRLSAREQGSIRGTVERLVAMMEAGGVEARFFFSDD